jgi:hypothetical protein
VVHFLISFSLLRCYLFRDAFLNHNLNLLNHSPDTHTHTHTHTHTLFLSIVPCGIFLSLSTISQALKQSLAHNSHSINICWINQWIPLSQAPALFIHPTDIFLFELSLCPWSNIRSGSWLMSDLSHICSGLRVIYLGLHSWLCHFLIMWPWVSQSVFLGPAFLICKTGLMIASELLRVRQTHQQLYRSISMFVGYFYLLSGQRIEEATWHTEKLNISSKRNWFWVLFFLLSVWVLILAPFLYINEEDIFSQNGLRYQMR